MTPERMAEVVARWVRLYTRRLPPPVAQRRIAEIDADLHDHIALERAHGTSDGRIARSIAARMVRGLPADASWRGQKLAQAPTPKDSMTAAASRSVIRVAAATGFLLLVLVVAAQLLEGMDWGVFDFVFAGALFAGTGLLIELAVRNPGNLVLRGAAVAVGVAAIAFGEADDAPGLVAFGCLLVLGALAITVRTVLRSE
jgi:hypothetical protein